jgi:hypothetical protein
MGSVEEYVGSGSRTPEMYSIGPDGFIFEKII